MLEQIFLTNFKLLKGIQMNAYFKSMLDTIIGCMAVILLCLSTTLFFIPILVIGLLKLIPYQNWQLMCTRWIDKVIECWIDVNRLYVHHALPTKIVGSNNIRLSQKSWYLVVANHQSWLDIVILQHVFNRQIPVLKFFIKDQLKWVPLLGFAWWAMGCAFMKRYSKAYLAKYPHKKGKDLKATRQAVKGFQCQPTAVMNFIEGTRFTQLKKKQQASPYQHLLKPKAGGVSFVIDAMPEQFDKMMDVTIVYPNTSVSLWDFLCRRLPEVDVHITPITIPAEFRKGQLLASNDTQMQFRTWLNLVWQEKDALITKIKSKH
tara:strand:- start:105 stop:1058 length:954 start_codon:yes stop_codon:yes gene_type:complete